MKKKFLAMLITAVMLVSLFGSIPAFAAGSAVVKFTGPTTVSPGQTYTYTYTLQVNGACAANANIALGGVFRLVSGGDNLFYDSIPKNTTGTVSGTIRVHVDSGVKPGSTAKIYVLTDESKCSELKFDSSGKVTGDPVITAVTGSINVKVVPATPAAPSVTSGGYDRLVVKWKAANGANGYEVWRATSSTGAYSKIASTTSTSYTNTGLTTNKTYYYKVKAYYKTSSGTIYGSLSARSLSKPIPATPAAKAVSASYSSIKVSWSKVAGATGYKLYRATSKSGSYSLIKSTTTALYYTNTGRTTGRTYYYKVRAYRKVGTTYVYSNYSSVVSAAPTLNGVTGVKAARKSSSSIKITWNSVSGRSGYELWRSTSKTGTYTRIKTTSYTYYTNTGLRTGKTYYYKVRAYRTVSGKKIYGKYSGIVYAKP